MWLTDDSAAETEDAETAVAAAAEAETCERMEEAA
jgi:hypothetical protein